MVKARTMPQVFATLKGRFSGLSPRKRQGILIGAVLITLLAARVTWRLLTTESTDDAFVTARVHTIAAHVSGTVAEIPTDDHRTVKKGDLLVQLDSRDYQVQLKIAQANYGKAHQDLGRIRHTSVIAPDEKPLFDAYTAAALTAEAELERAQLNLEYTRITAPADGTVGKRTVEVGNQIGVGQALMALVEPNPWIIANFKELQLRSIRPGQEVEIRVDAIPDRHFRGHVDSVSPASGATFSLLPPDNATGNFTKIVQRVPVKITFDADSIKGFENRIAAGMSTEVTVFTR